jgi:hypothetical protein
MVAAGVSHFVRANHVEVQRRQYQWWAYRVPWLRNTHKEETRTGSFGFAEIVSGYLNLASGMTHEALKVDAAAEAANGNAEAMAKIESAARAEMIPLLPILKVLGPNPRAILLGFSMLAGSPLYYFIYQIIVLNALMLISVARHNAAARRVAAQVA